MGSLADELKREQIEPWLCEVDIEFGDNFVAKIEEGLRDADLDALGMDFGDRPRDSEARTRLGIVLLRDGAIPELLRVN